MTKDRRYTRRDLHWLHPWRILVNIRPTMILWLSGHCRERDCSCWTIVPLESSMSHQCKDKEATREQRALLLLSLHSVVQEYCWSLLSSEHIEEMVSRYLLPCRSSSNLLRLVWNPLGIARWCSIHPRLDHRRFYWYRDSSSIDRCQCLQLFEEIRRDFRSDTIPSL